MAVKSSADRRVPILTWGFGALCICTAIGAAVAVAKARPTKTPTQAPPKETPNERIPQGKSPPADYTGRWITWHTNGKKAEDFLYVNGEQTSGIRWWEDGKKEFERSAVNANGDWITYHYLAGGSRETQLYTEHGKRMHAWHQHEGGLLQEFEEVEGKKEGPCYELSKGQLKVGLYRNGELVEGHGVRRLE